MLDAIRRSLASHGLVAGTAVGLSTPRNVAGRRADITQRERRPAPQDSCVHGRGPEESDYRLRIEPAMESKRDAVTDHRRTSHGQPQDVPVTGRGSHERFHPTKPWMYVSIEPQNKMYTYKMEAGRINPEIAFRAETLAEPANRRSRQAAGTVHVHPNGRFLYGANRAQDTVDFQGKKVFK